MTYQDLRNEILALQNRLAEIKALCRKYNHAGCNPGTHDFANEVLKIAEREGE